MPTSVGSLKKQESSRQTFTSALLTIAKPLTVWITTNYGKIQEMGLPDHLTCLLRNLYAGQEPTVRTGHGTTDWFQIGKGVHQGCILSPCLFKLYAEYLMRNAGLDKAQAGIKIARRNINKPMQISLSILLLWLKYFLQLDLAFLVSCLTTLLFCLSHDLGSPWYKSSSLLLWMFL